MAISLESFNKQLIASGLMSAAAVQTALGSMGTAARDGVAFAKWLVTQQRLTPYQAQEILAGNGKSLVKGNYVILDLLGQGGMGMVLKAEHRRMERVVALKILSPSVTNNPDILRRFQREVKAAAKLEHPHIVTAHDADEANGTHFLVMQYVEGQDLAKYVETHGALTPAEAIRVVLQAARGLEYAHSRGVVHRDIKPANLLLDHEQTLKILDMGLARLETPPGQQEQQLTGCGQIMGTVDFMAPEQAKNFKNADGRADIYSLGATLWYLVTGRLLFERESLFEKLLAHQKDPNPALRDGCPQASEELGAIFAQMIAKDPQARYQRMSEVITALESLQTTTSPTPLPRDPAPIAAATQIKSSFEPTVQVQSADIATDPTTEQVLAAPQFTAAPPRGSQWIAIGGCLLVLLLAAALFLLPTGAGQKVSEATPASTAVKVATTSTAAGTPATASSAAPTTAPSSSDPALPTFAGQSVLDFDGIDDYVEIPSLQYDGTHDLTTEMWMKVSGEGTALIIGGDQVQWILSNTELGVLRLTWVEAKALSVSARFTPDDSFHHLCSICEGGKFRFYIDGKPSILAGGGGRFPKLERAKTTIGGETGLMRMRGTGCLKCQLHSLRISNTVRYRKGFTPPAELKLDPDTMALYQVTSSTAQTLLDATGQHDGTIHGATTQRVPP